MIEPFKNDWNEETAREIDAFWGSGLQELMLHAVEGVLCMEYTQAGEKILEVGCGSGRLYDIIKRGMAISYTGLDMSSAMLKIFKERHPDVPLALGDATKLPFPNNSFDVVICFEVIRHLMDYQAVIAELYRVAKREVLFNIDVCEGPTIVLGEERFGGYLPNEDQYVHYQVEHCSSDFVHWIRTNYTCNIDIRTLSNTKYAFVLHKMQRGLALTISPVDGMQRFEVELLRVITNCGKILNKAFADPGGVAIDIKVASLRPIGISPNIILREPN